MWNWIVDHAAALQVLVALITAAVWIVYLSIFARSLRRQRRSEILITLGGNKSLRGQILVGNLGLEPIYVLDILVRLSVKSGDRVVSVSDRNDFKADSSVQKQVTLQGPLKSGDHVDIGTVQTLLERAALDNYGDLSRIGITVAAVTAAASRIIAARRDFHVTLKDGVTVLRPATLNTHQIRDRRGRRRLERQLLAML